MLTRDGKQYYKAQEAAKLAGVNARTLSRWIAAGQLAHFLFPFRESPGGPLYYRLEPPDETDTFGENRRGQNGPIFPLNRSVGTDISPKSVRFVKIDQVDGDKMQVDGDKKGGCLSPLPPRIEHLFEFCLGPNIRTEALVFFYQLCYVKNGSNGRRDRAVFWYAFHFLLILRMFFHTCVLSYREETLETGRGYRRR